MGCKAAHQGVSQLSDAVPGLPGLSASWRVIARNGLASHPPTLVLLDDDGQTVGARSLRRGELVLECCQNAAQQSSPASTLPSLGRWPRGLSKGGPACRAVASRVGGVAPLHSITSSARNKIDVGNSMPIALAVLRFTTSSNLLGCSIGISPTLVPLRILTTWVAACRCVATKGD
jgi:hypothetical protein